MHPNSIICALFGLFCSSGAQSPNTTDAPVVVDNEPMTLHHATLLEKDNTTVYGDITITSRLGSSALMVEVSLGGIPEREFLGRSRQSHLHLGSCLLTKQRLPHPRLSRSLRRKLLSHRCTLRPLRSRPDTPLRHHSTAYLRSRRPERKAQSCMGSRGRGVPLDIHRLLPVEHSWDRSVLRQLELGCAWVQWRSPDVREFRNYSG